MNYNKKTFLLLSLISLTVLSGCVVEPSPSARPYYASTYSPVVYETYPYSPYYGSYYAPYYGPYHGSYGGWRHHHHWR